VRGDRGPEVSGAAAAGDAAAVEWRDVSGTVSGSVAGGAGAAVGEAEGGSAKTVRVWGGTPTETAGDGLVCGKGATVGSGDAAGRGDGVLGEAPATDRRKAATRADAGETGRVVAIVGTDSKEGVGDGASAQGGGGSPTAETGCGPGGPASSGCIAPVVTGN